MSSTSPSPSSSPTAIPPVSPTNPTPPAVSNPNTPPSPSTPLAPPPQSSPPPISSTPPPSPPQSPPLAPPPSPPASPPPSPPTAPPPSTNSAPPPASAPPPPTGGSAPPPQASLAPPVATPPPQASPAPPVAPPPPSAVSPFPPPPITGSPPPMSTSPPPPVAHPPKHPHSPPPPPLPPSPIGSQPAPPTSSPPPASTASPPPTIFISPIPPLNNSSVNGSTVVSPIPSLPTEKPTARPTQAGPNITADATTGNSGGLKAGGVAAVVSVVGFLALTFLVLAVLFTRRRKKRKDKFTLNYDMPSPFASSQNSDSSFLRPQHSAQLAGSPSNNFIYSQDGGMGASRSWFTFDDLSDATDGFSASKLLGEGGFGCVYKGVLVDGREVAVKQLKAGGGQGEREFRAEVEIISRIHHKHLVSLVGYCISDNQRLLVYDYVPNDTLHHHLHGNDTVMDWASRVKVAAGAARGLAYLHEDCQPRIIHRDIKSTNILLNDNFEAKVADFGLAKLALELDLHTHVSTRVMGTFGYLAPEYASSGKLTEKSDVFSFGVMLLELITGRKPVDASRPLGDESLVEWARPLLNQALETEDFGDELIDYRLEKNYIASEMLRMIEAAAACVRHSASKRPRMSQVVRALNSMDELADLNNGMKPGQSGIFDSREHSAQIRMFQRMAFGSQDYNSSEILSNSQSSWRTDL